MTPPAVTVADETRVHPCGQSLVLYRRVTARRLLPWIAFALWVGSYAPLHAQPWPHDSGQEFITFQGEPVTDAQPVDPEPQPAPPATPEIVFSKPSYKLGEKITIEFRGDPLEGAVSTFDWTLPKAFVEVDKFDGDRRLVPYTTAPGNFPIALTVTSSLTVLTPDPADPTNPAKFKTRVLSFKNQYAGTLVVTGSAPVPPKPVPPGPDPPPTPVVEGRRVVVILHESGEPTAEFGRMKLALRKQGGEHAKYLAAKGHSLLILDKETPDENGQPLAIVTQLNAINVPLPALFIINADTGDLLHSQPLTAQANAAGVMQVLREHGG